VSIGMARAQAPHSQVAIRLQVAIGS
jgi:hypothetical protein